MYIVPFFCYLLPCLTNCSINLYLTKTYHSHTDDGLFEMVEMFVVIVNYLTGIRVFRIHTGFFAAGGGVGDTACT